MPQGALNVPDAEFWGNPLKSRQQLDRPLLAAGKEAIVLDGPHKVALDVRQTLPLVAVRVAKFAAAVGAPFDTFAILVGRDLESGRVRVARAVPPPVKREKPDEPQEGDPAAMTSETARIDARARLDVPWRPGRFAFALLVREVISDDVQVELDTSPGGYKDPAVEQHRRDEAKKAPLPDVAPALAAGKPVPAYGAVDDAPPVPAQRGIALSGPRVFKRKTEGPLVVKGSFRLEVPEHLLVSGERGAKAAEQGGGKEPGALVPLTLVITGSAQPAPLAFHLVVPSFEVDAKTRVAAGSFAVDLDGAGTLRDVDRTLFVYAFSGAERFGPLPIALVEE